MRTTSLLLTLATVSSLELTPDNWAEKTKDKNARAGATARLRRRARDRHTLGSTPTPRQSHDADERERNRRARRRRAHATSKITPSPQVFIKVFTETLGAANQGEFRGANGDEISD